MYVPILEDLVGDDSTFFGEFFDSRPLLRRGAIPVDRREILDLRDLDELLGLEAIRYPYLRIARDGVSVREASYTTSSDVQNETVTDRIVPERVHELFRSGATITWNCLNHFRPNLKALTDALSDRFLTDSDVIAFLTPAGKHGYSPHHDPVDVFVIQLAGTKHWHVWETPVRRRGDTAHFDLDELGDPAMQETLRPGDVLYLPYNTPHMAAAQEGLSLHLSVVVRPRPWRELLLDVVARVVEDDPMFWRAPYLGGAQGHDLTETLRGHLKELSARLDLLDHAAEMARLRNQHLPPGQNPGRATVFADLAALDSIDERSVLARSVYVELAFGESSQGRTPLVVRSSGGPHRGSTAETAATASTLRVSDRVAWSLRKLGPGDTVAAGEFVSGVAPDRSVEAARLLARAGILHVQS